MNHVIPPPCDFQLVANSRSFLNLNLVEEIFYITRKKDILKKKFFIGRIERFETKIKIT